MVLLLWHDGKLADALCNFDRLLLQLVGVFLLLRRHRSQLSRTVLLLLLLLLHFRTLAKEVKKKKQDRAAELHGPASSSSSSSLSDPCQRSAQSQRMRDRACRMLLAARDAFVFSRRSSRRTHSSTRMPLRHRHGLAVDCSCSRRCLQTESSARRRSRQIRGTCT